MRQERGFSLIEVLVAVIILAMVTGYTGVSHVTIRRLLSQERGYRFTALNLAREMLEYGETMRINSGVSTYSYSGGTYKTTYGVALPFSSLGDIKAKGLVPKSYPNSVVISYTRSTDGNFYHAYTHGVEVGWTDDDGFEKKEVLAGIPITQVNDQLNLNVAEFWWE